MVNFRRGYVCVVDIWSVLLHMLVIFIYIIKHLIHPRLVGVPQYHKAHEWLEELFHQMALVE